MTVLVLGGSGLLGRACLRVGGAGRVVGTGLTRFGDLLHVDSRDRKALERVVEHVKPRVVVNLVADRDPANWVNSEHMRAANVLTAENAAHVAEAHGAGLVHASTDYVFASGGPHRPDDPHNPTNNYGATKSQSERAVRAIAPLAVVARFPVLYGPVERPSECNLVMLFARVLAARGRLEVDRWAVRRPTHVDDVATSLLNVAGRFDDFAGRTIHLSAANAMTSFDMARAVCDVLGLDSSALQPLDTPTPSRPQQVELEVSTDEALAVASYRDLVSALPSLVANYTAMVS